jgi:hypothetical protein
MIWNARVTLTVLASLVLLVLLCSLTGAAYAPFYTDRRAARLTSIADGLNTATAAVTQAAGATSLARIPTQTAVAGATQTEAARPTATPTPTLTPTITPTPTATPPAAIVACPATVAGTSRLIYPVPGGGQVLDAVLLPRDTSVSVIGRLQDQGWLYVQTPDGATGWMRSDVLNLGRSGCQANIYSLSYLLGMADGREIVADDTFISNENGWHNSAGDPISPVITAAGDAQLAVMAANGIERLRPSSHALRNAPIFDLATSFSRVNFLTGSYVGVRFRVGDLTYYEVRIARNCQVGVYAVNELIFTRPVDPGPNTCVDDQEDWLRLSLSDDYRLRVQLNDADAFDVVLEDPAGLYTGGGIELVVAHARATFSYLVVTAPR